MYTIFPYTTFRNYMVIIYNKPCICILFSIPIYIYIPIYTTGWWFGTFFPFSWEVHNPNWRTPSFFRGVSIPPTSISSYYYMFPSPFTYQKLVRFHPPLKFIPYMYIYTICIPYYIHIYTILWEFCDRPLPGLWPNPAWRSAPFGKRSPRGRCDRAPWRRPRKPWWSVFSKGKVMIPSGELT